MPGGIDWHFFRLDGGHYVVQHRKAWRAYRLFFLPAGSYSWKALGRFPGFAEAVTRAVKHSGAHTINLARRNPTPKPARKHARAPLGFEAAEWADLNARVVEARVRRGGAIKFRGGRALYWYPKARALVWLRGAKPAEPDHAGHAQAAHARERFANRAASHTRAITLPELTWTRLGPAEAIVYRSDRSGHPVTWEHEFSSGPGLYRGTGAGVTLWAIMGRGVRLTGRGIMG